jgi:hypothetical protein
MRGIGGPEIGKAAKRGEVPAPARVARDQLDAGITLDGTVRGLRGSLRLLGGATRPAVISPFGRSRGSRLVEAGAGEGRPPDPGPLKR